MTRTQQTPFTIRQATLDDNQAIWDVNRAGWQAYTHIFTPEEVDRVFSHRASIHASWVRQRGAAIGTQVAEHDGHIVGFISLARLWGNDEGEITALYIQPEHQGRGLGRRLWEQGIGLLRAQQCPAVWVWVLARAPAVAFYEHMGCQRLQDGIYSVDDHTEIAYGYKLGLL